MGKQRIVRKSFCSLSFPTDLLNKCIFFYKSLQNYISLGVTKLLFPNWNHIFLFPFNIKKTVTPDLYGSNAKTLSIQLPDLKDLLPPSYRSANPPSVNLYPDPSWGGKFSSFFLQNKRLLFCSFTQWTHKVEIVEICSLLFRYYFSVLFSWVQIFGRRYTTVNYARIIGH